MSTRTISAPLVRLAAHVPGGLGPVPLVRSLELTRHHTLACRTGRVRSIGTASTGEELLLFSVGSGKEHFFVEGGPHLPGESFSLDSTPQLMRITGQAIDEGDPLLSRCTLSVLAVCDPASARLGPARRATSIEEHFTCYFRAAAEDQPPWGYPGQLNGTFRLAESEAAARWILEHQPRGAVSLHDTEFSSGCHFVTVGASACLAKLLSTLPPQFDLGYEDNTWDTADFPVPARGVRAHPPVGPEEPASALHYAHLASGAAGVMPEPAHWTIQGPPEPTAGAWATTLRELARQAELAVEPLYTATDQSHGSPCNCPVIRAFHRARTFSSSEFTRIRNLPRPGDPADRQAVWASNWATVQRLPLRIAGLALALERPHHCPRGRHRLSEPIRGRANALIEQRAQTLRTVGHARPVPVASAVRVHLASVYAVIEDALRDP